MIDFFPIGTIDNYSNYLNFKDLNETFGTDPVDTVQIYVIYVGMVELFKLQYKLLVKFSKFKFKLNVIDFGDDCAELKQFCTHNSINYLYIKKIFNRRFGGDNVNYETSLVFNYIYRVLFKKSGCRYFSLLQHDVFPISKIDMEPLYTSGMSASVQYMEFKVETGEKVGRIYPWVGLMFIDTEKYNDLDFRYGICGVTTGTSKNKIHEEIEMSSDDVDVFTSSMRDVYDTLHMYRYRNRFEPGALVPITNADIYFEYDSDDNVGRFNGMECYSLHKDYKLIKLVENSVDVNDWSGEGNGNIIRGGYIEQFGGWVHGIGISNWFKDSISSIDNAYHGIKVEEFSTFLNKLV